MRTRIAVVVTTLFRFYVLNIKALTPYVRNCKDLYNKVGEKIVAHKKTIEIIVAVVKKSCSVYGR